MPEIIAGIRVPDSKLCQEVRELVRDTETDLLYHHSNRVFLFGALTGERRGLEFDCELLYVGAMFHDMGLTDRYSTNERFEVDGANAARDFLRRHAIPESDVDEVWDAIALHTTPGIPQHKRPVVALVTAGVEMDVVGVAYEELTKEQRDQVLASHPRGLDFKEGIIDAFTRGMIKRPETTFGTMNADVLERMDPKFRRVNFCSLILESPWPT
ncbi:MAG: phosphohydrolase [Myxococcales bacterium 68-20]|nr:MAG: phosphohydrolase [Myxococcales bacterium 68-20]